jgi:preprotein translocase subunit SecE
VAKQIENNKKQTDIIWLMFSLIGVVVSIASFYVLDQSTLMKVLILLGGIVVSIFVLFQGSYGTRIIFFIKETKIELLKVVWPSRNETLKMTLIIIIAVIIIGIFLWLIDMFFLWAVQLLI